jgi:hypothetical protein
LQSLDRFLVEQCFHFTLPGVARVTGAV